MSALPALVLLIDGSAKLVKPAMMKGTISLGYRESAIVPLGIVLLSCMLLYLIPRTAILGAILLSGYLGGAVATHVRVGESIFNILLPVVLAVLLWGGGFGCGMTSSVGWCPSDLNPLLAVSINR